MANIKLTYRVTGRYMSGSAVEAYHLVGEDGSQVVANKERVIYMLGKGQIDNMRLQANGDDILIRGKGINLTKLPIFDMNKKDFRDNDASRVAASTAVNPKKNSGINPMGQLKITKRIMYKTSCLGYIVTDLSGKERKVSRKKIIELATQKLISNAVVQKYTPKGETECQLILRGIGCDISSLPIIAVDQDGNLIEQVEQKVEKKEEQVVYMRAAKMKRGGIIYDNNKGVKLAFEPGDFIVCGINGTLRPIKSVDAASRLEPVSGSAEAICDDNLDKLGLYPIELFGSTQQCLSEAQVKKWAVVKIAKAS